MTRKSGKCLRLTYGITEQKGKKNIFPCPWGYDNYADAYFHSSLEAMALEFTVCPVKSMDVTYKTHSG